MPRMHRLLITAILLLAVQFVQAAWVITLMSKLNQQRCPKSCVRELSNIMAKDCIEEVWSISKQLQLTTNTKAEPCLRLIQVFIDNYHTGASYKELVGKNRTALEEDSKEDSCNQLFLRGFCLTSDDTTALLMVCISAPTFDVASTPDWAAVCDWSTLERHSAVQEKECTSMALMIFLCIGMSVICAILGVAIGYGFSSSSRRKEEKTDEKVIESHSTDKKKEENPDEKVTQSHSTDKKKEEA